MSLSIPSVLRRGPNVAEGGGVPSFPPQDMASVPLAFPKTEEQREQRAAQMRAFEESEKAARDAEKRRADEAWTERQLKQRKLDDATQTRQAAFVAERQRLEAEIDNARTAQGQLAGGGSLATVEGAVAAIRSQALASAAIEVTARAEGRLRAHRDSQRIR